MQISKARANIPARKKMTKRLFRGRRDPKHGNRFNYKGYGAPTMGKHTSKGRFIVTEKKQANIVFPDLDGFELKPYVAYNTQKIKVPKPEVPEMTLEDLHNAEVDIRDIIAPQHKQLRELKQKELEAIEQLRNAREQQVMEDSK